MIPTLISIATVIAAVWLQVSVHSRKIKRGEMSWRIKWEWAFWRTLLFALVPLLVCWGTHGSLLSAGLNIAGSCLLFPALFNPWISQRQRWSPWYLGVTSWWDARIVGLFTKMTVAQLRWVSPSGHGESRHQALYNEEHMGVTYRKLVHRAGKAWFRACLITSALLYGTGVILSNTN